MRLYDTFTRGLRDLPAPPGPIRIYSCGPTVYQRIHVGNAIPFVISMWLKRWLVETGHETKLVINITDINDKIYDAAPGASAKLAADASRWYLEDTDRLGLGRPDFEPTAVETVGRPDRDDRGARRARLRVRVRRGRVLPGHELSGVRPPERAAARPGRGAGAEPAQGGPARLRALEGDEGGRGHVLGLALGARATGLAHRVLGHVREAPRPRVRDPRRRARPRVPASRERDRAVARARAPVRAALDAQRDAHLLRRGDAQVGRQRRVPARTRSTAGGARRCSSSS